MLLPCFRKGSLPLSLPLSLLAIPSRRRPSPARRSLSGLLIQSDWLRNIPLETKGADNVLILFHSWLFQLGIMVVILGFISLVTRGSEKSQVRPFLGCCTADSQTWDFSLQYSTVESGYSDTLWNLNFSRTVAGITKWFLVTIEGYLSYLLPKFEDLAPTS